MKSPAVEAAWAALAGASACLDGLILDRSAILADSIEEPQLNQAKAALFDARAARDELSVALQREAFETAVALFEPGPKREYESLLQLRGVVRDGLSETDGLADVLSLDGGELVPLVTRLRDGFQAVADGLAAG